MLKSWRLILGALWVVLAIVSQGTAQNAATGAIAGTVTDASGASVVGAQVKVTNEATGEVRRVTSRSDGSILISLLPPGGYSIIVTAPGFKTVDVSKVTVTVTETVNVPVRLEVGATNESVTVTGSELQVNTESAELGTVTSRQMIQSLPLVTRNYTQIIALNPGISAEVSNAGELGKGSSSYGASTGGFSAQGGNTNDNNFQMNGVTVSDTFASAQFSGGIAVPNPDTLQEFKVLTGQYDASYGRNAGANVNVITRGGTNDFHGSVFEYFRNDALNANEFFQKRNNQPRPVLRSNQFGFTFGGPLKKNKLLFFGSYQGTRQRNGMAAGCLSRVELPPLTNDRSAAALGAIFGGNVGYFNYALGVTAGVPTIAVDGSNINPVALKLLQAKLPNGQYLIPTPQSVQAYTPSADPSVIDSVGTSTFSSPCPYTEDQYMGNLDYLQSDKSKWSGRTFVANSQATQSLAAGVPGFGVITPADYRNISLANSYVFSPALLNQLTIGFTRQLAGQIQANPYKFSDFGITGLTDGPPVIYLNALTTGLNIGGKGQTQTAAQNTYEVTDSISWIHGKHSFRFGGGVTRWQYNASNLQYSGVMEFLTFSDLLLGNDANTAGLGAYGYGNLYGSIALIGDLARDYRIWENNAWVQDDVRITKRLTLNLGFRYERLGGMSEKWGRNTSFDFALADPTPPATGTLAGYLVPSNFRSTIPDGVTKSGNNMGIAGDGQNTWNPRFGFAWQLPGTDRLVLRGGYGMFHSRTTGVGLIQSLSAPPLSYIVNDVGAANAAATAANPYVSPLPTLPYFPLITPTSAQTPQVLSQSYRPPTYQRYSLGLQAALAKDTVLEVDYVGARDTQLIRQRNIDQAQLASPDNPIRGVTTNTSATSNIRARLPYQGLSPTGARIYENGAAGWYNSLQVSANKRMSHGLTLQGSYTFARALSDSPGSISATIGGRPNGNTNDPRSTYGPDPFVREHRFVLSYLYNLPGPKDVNSFAGRILGNWSLSGVTVAQSGHRLTFGYTNAANVFGINSDRPDYVPGCNINTSGGVESRLNAYWNPACFTKPAALAAPNSGTLFGTSPIGLGHGPDQVNFDISIAKQIPIKWPNEVSRLEFYTQFFNALNHPQFADPSTQFTGTGFGANAITSTVTNPRIIQFALKYSF
ncbi:MAG: carboxypeptidase regulatory-like domain-containing protein [Terriglobia bacterium]|nr:carboxypeptidase regulatory-like domain-containing protein [Terriglobia bacterium]